MRIGCAIAALLVAASLAGCAAEQATDGDGSGNGSTNQPLTPAAQPQADESTASVTGVVTDDELAPVPGAQVAMVETGAITFSDDAGNFTINGIEPGVYTLVVERLGFESSARKLPLAAGQIAKVDVSLKRIEIPEEPIYVSNPVSAYITFGHAWTDYYGGWDVLPACGECEFYVHLTPKPTDIENEASWVKGINADVFSGQIYYLIRKNTDNSSAATVVDGVSVTSGYWTYGDMPRPMESGDYQQALDALKDETDLIQIKIGGGFTSVAVQQRVDIWITFAYNGELPEGFSAFPPDE